MGLHMVRSGVLRLAALATVASVGLMAAGCSSGEDSPIPAKAMSSKLSIDSLGAQTSECSAYKPYGDFEAGTRVEIRGAIADQEAALFADSLKQFEECTKITVSYIGSDEFATGIIVRAQAENPPDLAIFPQPALFSSMASAGYLVPAPGSVVDNIHSLWSEYWQRNGIVDGKVYGAPLTASVKGYVWYSPAEFETQGYAVPTTLAELTTLTKTIAKAGKHTPWCEGFASGDASGWPGTDWVEDMVLRNAGPNVYDKWVAHEIPFNDPQIVQALDSVGALIKDPANVNDGDIASIATTEFEDAGSPLLDGTCSLYHQASFYEGFWKKADGTDVRVAPDGDVWAFMLPGVDATSRSVVVGGDLVGAFNSDDATKAVQRYLSSDTWANNRVSLGGVISANTGVDPAGASSALLSDSIRILQHPDTIIRFDASDVMPTVVGSGSFWHGMMDWINGQSTNTVLDAIEITWPQAGTMHDDQATG